MSPKNRSPRQNEKQVGEVKELKAKLRETEDALRAIHEGEVDAIVVRGSRGEHIFSLNTPDDAYRQIVQTMNESAFTTTLSGQILFCNGQFERLMGFPMTALVGKYLLGLVDKESADDTGALIRETGLHGTRKRIVFSTSSGAIPTLIAGCPLLQADELALCFVATDLTEMEAKAAQLARQTEELQATIEELRSEAEAKAALEEELRESASQLRRLAGELALTEQKERQRLATMLHEDLQQILIAIRLQIENLRKQGGEELAARINQIDELVGQSIEKSRSLTAELGPPVLRTSGFGPALQWLVKWMAGKHELTTDLSVPATMPCMAEDVALQLFQSVRELLLNVVKHSQVKKAALAVTSSAETLSITVSDDGRGFDVTRIKERTGTESFGIFSIQERLTLLGGTLAMESAPKLGSRFTMLLPVASLGHQASWDAPAVARKHPARPTPSAQDASHSRKIRVILADDFELTRKGVALLVEDAGDMEVVGEAADGLEAVEMARRLSPDVVIMDLSMPKMNGIEATQRIMAEMPSVRVIGLSMYEKGDGEEAMRKAGAVAYLTKDGPSKDLMAAIREAMARQ